MLIELCWGRPPWNCRNDSSSLEARLSAVAWWAALDVVTKTQKRLWDLPSIIYRLIRHVLTLTECLHTQTRHQMMRMSTAAIRVIDCFFSMFWNERSCCFFILFFSFLCNIVVKLFYELFGARQHQRVVMLRFKQVLENCCWTLLSPQRLFYHDL